MESILHCAYCICYIEKKNTLEIRQRLSIIFRWPPNFIGIVFIRSTAKYQSQDYDQCYNYNWSFIPSADNGSACAAILEYIIIISAALRSLLLSEEIGIVVTGPFVVIVDGRSAVHSRSRCPPHMLLIEASLRVIIRPEAASIP